MFRHSGSKPAVAPEASNAVAVPGLFFLSLISGDVDLAFLAIP